MKLIIDVNETYFKQLQTELKNNPEYPNLDYCQIIIASGKPYEERPQGDLISRSALISAIEKGEGISWERYGDNEVCVRKKYIDNAPTVEPEELIKPIAEIKCEISEEEKQRIIEILRKEKPKLIKLEPERPQGEWIKEPNGRTTDIYRCSVCKRSIMLCKGADLTNYPFCHCGVDMRKGSSDENSN